VLAGIDCQNVREPAAFLADGHVGHSTDDREIRKAPEHSFPHINVSHPSAEVVFGYVIVFEMYV